MTFSIRTRCRKGAIRLITRSPRLRRLHKKSIFCTKSPPLVELYVQSPLDPKLLLLDEPSTGLMREERENLARFLLRIRHELQITMLWVEHDMQLVTDLADRIVVFDHGEVIADGTADVVRRMPNVIAAFLGPEESDNTSVHLATS